MTVKCDTTLFLVQHPASTAAHDWWSHFPMLRPETVEPKQKGSQLMTSTDDLEALIQRQLAKDEALQTQGPTEEELEAAIQSALNTPPQQSSEDPGDSRHVALNSEALTDNLKRTLNATD